MARKKKRPERDNCIWTEEEDEFLAEMAGSASYDFIGSRLKRSPEAVRKRLEDSGTSDKYLITGMLSARELARCLNRDVGYVLDLIRNHGLPAKTPNTTFKEKKQIVYYFIQPECFWRWADKNRDKLNFAQIEKDSILPEPAWLEAQQRVDFYKPVSRKKWKPEEEAEVLRLFYSGTTQKEIAKIFNRPVSGIAWIIKKHRKKETTEG